MRRLAAYVTLLAALVAGGVGGYTTLLSEPNEIRMNLDPATTTVTVGQEFTVSVEVENVDLDAIPLNAIGLEQSLLDGVEVVSIDPAYLKTEDKSIPVYGEWTEYQLGRNLSGGEKITITLTLRSKQAGLFSGNVTAWVTGDVFGMSMGRARRATLEINAFDG